MEKIKVWNVWMEGFKATGQHEQAQQLKSPNGENYMWRGDTFKEACKNALKSLDWNMEYYDEDRNTFWGCRFFDNEEDARKSFG